MFDIEDVRLKKYLLFIAKLDELKLVIRGTSIIGKKRRENSAEHSWHIAVMALLLSEYANNKIDVNKVIKMLLLHDIGEIFTGDAVLYDEKKRTKLNEKERIFVKDFLSSLPTDTVSEYYNLWSEFDLGETDEAKFAKSIDRLQPFNSKFGK